MKTAEEIIKQMCDEMPFHLAESIKPYIIETMKIYARQACEEQRQKCASEWFIYDEMSDEKIASTPLIDLK